MRVARGLEGADLQGDGEQRVCSPFKEGSDALTGHKRPKCLPEVSKGTMLQPDTYGVQGVPCKTSSR